jgi:hypothetical protein
MNFDIQNKKFNDLYDKIKHKIKVGIKKNKLVFGSGGSNNLIILNDNYVLKIIPKFIDKNLKKQRNNDELEAEYYKTFTNNIILKNKSPHIVGIYKKYTLQDIKFIFPTKCISLDKKIKLPNRKINYEVERLCDLKKCYYRHTLEKKISILVLENCPTNIGEQIINILKSKDKENMPRNLVQIIRRVIFQIIFTLTIIQEAYPDFIHNDLFLRNILAIYDNSYDPDDYVQYNYNNKSYYLPANGIYCKINDFGFSLNIAKNSTVVDEINNNLNTKFELKNNKRDIYSFLYDLYDGPGLGSKSILQLLEANIRNKIKRKKLLSLVRKEIGLFFDYKTIDKLNKNLLDWNWSIGESKILMKTIKKPNEYFKNNSFEYYTKLPNNCRIVKIFN